MFAYMRPPVFGGGLGLLGLVLGATVPAHGESWTMEVNGRTNPPVGYIQFCKDFSTECEANSSEGVRRLSNDRLRDLEEVNHFVNQIVVPATDLDIYGVEELWTLPDVYGDCEDYVLLKRKWLIERGWPSGSLLVTVVFDEVGDGHAVLLAQTSRGEYVLDNKTDEIRLWHETSYRFVKRQSASDPNRWVSLGDPRWTTAATAAAR